MSELVSGRMFECLNEWCGSDLRVWGGGICWWQSSRACRLPTRRWCRWYPLPPPADSHTQPVTATHSESQPSHSNTRIVSRYNNITSNPECMHTVHHTACLPAHLGDYIRRVEQQHIDSTSESLSHPLHVVSCQVDGPAESREHKV